MMIGVDRFATTEMIKARTVKSSYSDALALAEELFSKHSSSLSDIKKLCPEGGPVLGRMHDGSLYVMSDDVHAMTVGMSGQGKTYREILHHLATDAMSGRSFVVTDLKGELYRELAPLLDAVGVNTYVLDFRNPLGSPSRYNPLSAPYDLYEAGYKDAARQLLSDFADSLYAVMKDAGDDPFWALSAKGYITGLLNAILECGQCPRKSFTIETLARVESASIESKRRFIANMADGSIGRQLASQTLDAPNDTRSSIESVAREPLNEYVQLDGLMQMLYNSDFDVDNLSNPCCPAALFIISPDETPIFAPVVVGIMTQLIALLIRKAEGEHNGRLLQSVDFVFDEFGQIGSKIPRLPSFISAARSRGIRLHLCLQSLGQLSKVYGEEDSDIILDNIGLQIYFGGQGAGAEEISKRCGVSVTPSGQQVPTLSPQDIHQLEKREDESEAVILLRGLPPYIGTLPDFRSFRSRPHSVHSSNKQKSGARLPRSIFALPKKYPPLIPSQDKSQASKLAQESKSDSSSRETDTLRMLKDFLEQQDD